MDEEGRSPEASAVNNETESNEFDCGDQDGVSAGGLIGSNFIRKLFEICSDTRYAQIIKWCPDGLSFQVIDPKKLESEVLPKYFRHAKFQSFVRQLNFYKFQRASKGRSSWIYCHDLFQKQRPELLDGLRRKTHSVCKAIVDMASNFAEELMQDNGASVDPNPQVLLGPAQGYDPLTLGHMPLFQLDGTGQYLALAHQNADKMFLGPGDPSLTSLLPTPAGYIAIPTALNITGTTAPIFTLAQLYPHLSYGQSPLPISVAASTPLVSLHQLGIHNSVAARQGSNITSNNRPRKVLPAKNTAKPAKDIHSEQVASPPHSPVQTPLPTPISSTVGGTSSGKFFKDLIFRPPDISKSDESEPSSCVSEPVRCTNDRATNEIICAINISSSPESRFSRKRSLSTSSLNTMPSIWTKISKPKLQNPIVPMLDLLPFTETHKSQKRVDCCKIYSVELSSDLIELAATASEPSASTLLGACKDVIDFFLRRCRKDSKISLDEEDTASPGRMSSAILDLLESNSGVYQDFVDYAATLSPVIAFELNKATPRPDGFLSPRHTYRSDRRGTPVDEGMTARSGSDGERTDRSLPGLSGNQNSYRILGEQPPSPSANPEYCDSMATSTDSMDDMDTIRSEKKQKTKSRIPLSTSTSSLSDVSTTLGLEFLRTFLMYAINNLRTASSCIDGALKETKTMFSSVCSCDKNSAVSHFGNKEMTKLCKLQESNLKKFAIDLEACADSLWCVVQSCM